MSFGYPVSLELADRKAVVIGDEAVRQGKVDALVAAGGRVTVVAEGPAAKLRQFEKDPRITLLRRRFHPDDLNGAFICVASSEDPEERASIYREGRGRRVLVNVMDDVAHCDFAAPAVVRRGDLTIAIGTGGRSPALARRLREELERRFGPEWEEILRLLGEVREETLAELPDVAERSERWSEALDLDELETLVGSGRGDEAREILRRRLVGARA
jgi:siroheme synthase-like protein